MLWYLTKSTAILEQLSSPTIKTNTMLKGITQIFELLIKHVPIFIGLCANMDNRTFNLVTQLREGEIYYHEYQKKIGNDLNVERYTSFNTLLHDATDLVMNNKRIFIVATHKSQAQILERYFNVLSKRVLCITSDSPR